MSGAVKVNQVLLGSNADQTKNFKITVPTPEDGTLTIERGDGTDVMKFLANGGVDMPSLPFSKSVNGYMTLPNGVIVQWGNAISDAGSDAVITFPIAFSTSPFICIGQITQDTLLICILTAASPSSATFATRNSNTQVGAGAGKNVNWLAIGY